MPGAKDLGSLQSGTFVWAPVVACIDNISTGEEDQTAATVPDSVGIDAHRVATEGGQTCWSAAATVPPTMAMRDGVRFGGVGVSLFVVDDIEVSSCSGRFPLERNTQT